MQFKLAPLVFCLVGFVRAAPVSEEKCKLTVGFAGPVMMSSTGTTHHANMFVSATPTGEIDVNTPSWRITQDGVEAKAETTNVMTFDWFDELVYDFEVTVCGTCADGSEVCETSEGSLPKMNVVAPPSVEEALPPPPPPPQKEVAPPLPPLLED